MELDSRKKSRRDKMMHSKSFEMQKVREIAQKEAGELRGFPILRMGIIEDVFQMEEKECEDQERLKCVGENPCQSKEGTLAWDRQLCMGQWQWMRRSLWQSQQVQSGRRGSKRTNKTFRY